MGNFHLVLDLPAEPDPAVFLQVMKLLGVLAPIGEAAATTKAAPPATENSTTPTIAAEEEPLLLSRDEAAALLNISTSTLDRWRKTGVLPVVKVPSGAPMFSRRALRKFVAENSKVSSPPQPRRARSADRAA